MSKTKSIALILGVLIMSFLIGYLIFAWTEPTASPPEGNVSAPVNVGPKDQWKEGLLGFGGSETSSGFPFELAAGEIAAKAFYDTDSSSWYINPASTGYAALFNGSVGIGTTGPDAKLDVLSTGTQLRLTYADGSFYSDLAVNSSGNLTITPSGTRISLASGKGLVLGSNTSDLAGVNGMMYYNSSTNTFRCYQNGGWTNCGGGGGTVTSISAGAGLTASPSDPITTSGTLNVGAGTGISVGADSISVIYGSTAGTAAEGNKTITVSAGTGLTGGGAITIGAGGSTSLSLNTAGISTCTNATTNKIIWDSTNNRLNCATDQTGGAGGFTCSPTCTSSYLAKFTGASTIGNSLIYDNGTQVAIGTNSPDTNYRLTIDSADATKYGIKVVASSAQPAAYIRNAGTGYGLIVDGGNVGIGTTSPGAKLTIKGGGLEVLRIEEGGDLTFCTGAGSCNVGLFSDNPDELTVGYGGNLKVNGNLNVGGKISGSIFGAWESKSLNTVYQAPSDGFVVAKITTPFGGKGWISGLTDSSNPPATERAVATVDSTTAANSSSFTMPVRKNDYWKVIYGDVSGTPVKLLYWIPLGN